MIRKISTTYVLVFSELNEEQREKAIEKHRYYNTEDVAWWGDVYETYTKAMKALGFELGSIYFSGFSSQGDGASFTGHWQYNPKWRVDLDKLEYGEWMRQDLIKFGLALQESKRIAVRIEQDGRYYHEYTMRFDSEYNREFMPENSDDWEGTWPYGDETDGLYETFRNIARHIYRALRDEYEYLTSDEAIAEMLNDDPDRFEFEFEFDDLSGEQRKRAILLTESEHI